MGSLFLVRGVYCGSRRLHRGDSMRPLGEESRSAVARADYLSGSQYVSRFRLLNSPDIPERKPWYCR
jgi:hypothetical protein